MTDAEALDDLVHCGEPNDIRCRHENHCRNRSCWVQLSKLTYNLFESAQISTWIPNSIAREGGIL